MTQIQQRPAELDIIYTKGDDMPISIILNMGISGHTITSRVIPAKSTTALDIVVAVILASTGSITLTFPSSTFGSIALGSHEWYLTDIDDNQKVRKLLAGLFTVVSR